MRRFALALASAATVIALSRAVAADDHNDPLAKIKALAGDWEVAVKYWTAADAKPGEASGTETNVLEVNGTVLRQNSKYAVGGVNVEQMMVMGYNAATKKYFANSYSTTTPGFLSAEGTFDDKGDKLTLDGSEKDPASGAEQKFRLVIRFENDDEYKVAVFLVVDGKDVKAAEYRYTRKK